MKVAIPSNEPRLDARVEGELCRGKYVLIVDVNTMTYEPVANPIMWLDSDVAMKVFVQELLQRNVSKVLARECSSDARKCLGLAGIQIIGILNGTARSVVGQLKAMCMAETTILPVKEVLE
jgi:predicted Fe-Mo cluster-binding NifX family protein